MFTIENMLGLSVQNVQHLNVVESTKQTARRAGSVSQRGAEWNYCTRQKRFPGSVFAAVKQNQSVCKGAPLPVQ